MIINTNIFICIPLKIKNTQEVNDIDKRIKKDYYISLGTNVGNKKLNLENAINAIKECGKIVMESSVYETEAWGKHDQAAFYNMVIRLKSELSPEDLMHKLLSIEQTLGRDRSKSAKWGERIIDLDILFAGREIIKESDLTIPHPYIQDRLFVLVPLNEIASDFTHPELGLSVEKLLRSCKDQLKVKKLSKSSSLKNHPE